MNFTYETISDQDAYKIKDLCNELMTFQKTKASISPEFFDKMNFETRMLPSIEKANHNFLMIVKDNNEIIAYVYSNISNKEVYDSEFATFFDMDSVSGDEVGCLSQFFIKENYRNKGIGSILFDESLNWMNSFKQIKDIFIYVSNGNTNALAFYKNKGFKESHKILDGFITVLRNL